jgi:serine/threonine protein kinase
VAIKVLPAELSADPGRQRRFEQEARAVAALAHPNIVTLHSIEEAHGRVFLTMELVEGTTLAALIRRKGLGLHQMLSLAVQMADATDAAHQKGITHRDLKPANVMVTADGRVKVLDFGLAKLREEAHGRGPVGRSSLRPLLARCHPLRDGHRRAAVQGRDERGDAVGHPQGHAGARERGDPDVPREVARVIRRCLAKDRELRYQSAKDLRIELEELKRESDSGELAARPGPSSGTTARGRRYVRVEVIGDPDVGERAMYAAPSSARMRLAVPPRRGMTQTWDRSGAPSADKSGIPATTTEAPSGVDSSPVTLRPRQMVSACSPPRPRTRTRIAPGSSRDT